MSKSRYLSELELFIVAAAARLGDEAYGAAIRREIESRAGRPINIGTIYATLARLESQGLLETWIARPEIAKRGSRSRRYCRTTPAGHRVLADTAGAVTRMLADLDLGLGGEETR